MEEGSVYDFTPISNQEAIDNSEKSHKSRKLIKVILEIIVWSYFIVFLILPITIYFILIITQPNNAGLGYVMILLNTALASYVYLKIFIGLCSIMLAFLASKSYVRIFLMLFGLITIILAIQHFLSPDYKIYNQANKNNRIRNQKEALDLINNCFVIEMMKMNNYDAGIYFVSTYNAPETHMNKYSGQSTNSYTAESKYYNDYVQAAKKLGNKCGFEIRITDMKKAKEENNRIKTRDEAIQLINNCYVSNITKFTLHRDEYYELILSDTIPQGKRPYSSLYSRIKVDAKYYEDYVKAAKEAENKCGFKIYL